MSGREGSGQAAGVSGMERPAWRRVRCEIGTKGVLIHDDHTVARRACHSCVESPELYLLYRAEKEDEVALQRHTRRDQ